MGFSVLDVLDQATAGTVTAGLTAAACHAWYRFVIRSADRTPAAPRPCAATQWWAAAGEDVQMTDRRHDFSLGDARASAAQEAVRLPDTFLSRLAEPARAAALRLGTVVRISAGSRFIHVGTAEDHSYLLLQGYAKVTGNDSGREPLLGIRLAGDLVGEMAALSGAPRSASVVACSPIQARRIGAEELRTFMGACPPATVEIAAMISERLRWANHRRIDFNTVPAAVRVSRVLVALDAPYRGTILLTQEEIASLAGVRRATAEKILRSLQENGALLLGYRHITVRDRGILEETAG